jgi:hypothetical protein
MSEDQLAIIACIPFVLLFLKILTFTPGLLGATSRREG